MTEDRFPWQDPRPMLRQHGLSPKGSFSQNFLCSEATARRIVAALNAGPGSFVVEIGAGLGALTGISLSMGHKLLAVELDKDMACVLEERFGHDDDFAVVREDAARFDYRAHAERIGADSDGSDIFVLGNLPYASTGAILRSIVDHADLISGAVLMMQREVAERLNAQPRSKSYGALPLHTAAAFDTKIVMHVKPGSFVPAPKVTSTVVSLTRPKVPKVTDAQKFHAVVKACFSLRRKTLQNALKTALGSSERAKFMCEQAGVDPMRRAESLTLEEFDRLSLEF